VGLGDGPSDDCGDPWDLDDDGGGYGWKIVAIAVAVLLVFGFWYWDDSHRGERTPTGTSEALGAVFEFGTPVDESQPTLHHWVWELTDHINTSGPRLTLGDMVWSVSGGPSSFALNLTAFDSAAAQPAAVWPFSGAWTYLGNYGATTPVGNQFVFLLYGTGNLDGATVTLSPASGAPFSGSASVLIPN
jgi:hypothetical protein